MTLSRILRSKYLVRAVLVVLLAFAAVRLGFPFLVQTETVAGSIERRLESWTGAEVELGGRTDFSFWPYPRVTLNDVRVGEAGALASIDAVSADFDLLGAVRGEPVFNDFELVRPVIHIVRDAQGAFNWPHGEWLKRAIETPESKGDERIGTISVRDGTVVIGDTRRVSDINGSIVWPALRQRLELSLSGVVNGETARWTFACDQPLSLIAGRDAAMRGTLSADPMTVSFDGTGNLSANAFISGALQLSTPSLGRLLTWQGKDIPAVGAMGQVALEANVSTSGYSARLENVRLALDNAQASGVLDIAMPPEGVPRIGGTLAFDRIDLRALLTALSPLPGTDANAPTIDTAFIHQLGMDLRLSARTADFSPFSLQDLAAGMRIENGRASFDVGDSTFMGGRLTGRIALSENGFRGGGQLQLSLGNVDIGGIVTALALPGPLPSGIGSADFELSTGQPLWATTASDMSGRFRLRMGTGTLNHFNRQAFEERAAKNEFFSMTQAANGSFDFARADVDARLDRGLAELTKAEFESGDRLLTLSGFIPYRSGSVALAGALSERPQADPAAAGKPPVGFFVGGSWPEPLISPASILSGRQPQ